MIKTKYDKYVNDNTKPVLDAIYNRAKEIIGFNSNAIIDMYVISYDATTGKTYFVAPIIPFKDVINCIVLHDSVKKSKYKPYDPEDFEIWIDGDKDYYINRMAKYCIKVMKNFNKCIFTIDVSDNNDIEPILIALDASRNNFKISDQAFNFVNWKCTVYGTIYSFLIRFKNMIDFEENKNSSLMFFNLINNCESFENIPKSILDGINLPNVNESMKKEELTEKIITTKKEEEPKMIIPDTEVYNNTEDKMKFNFKPGDLVIQKRTNNIFQIEDIEVFDDESVDSNTNPNILLYTSIEMVMDKTISNKVFLSKGFKHIMNRARFINEFINLNVKLDTE